MTSSWKLELGPQTAPHMSPVQSIAIQIPSNNSVCTRCVITEWPPISIGVRALPHSLRPTVFSQLSRLPTMDAKSQQMEGRDRTVSSLDTAIEALNLAKENSSITPTKAVFGSVSVLLAMIRVLFLLFCNDVLRIHTYPGLRGQ